MPGAPFELASSLSSQAKMTTTKKPTLQFGGTFKKSAAPATIKKTLDLTKSNKSKSRVYAPKPNDSVIKKDKSGLKKEEEKSKVENGLFDPLLSQETIRSRIRQAIVDKENVLFLFQTPLILALRLNTERGRITCRPITMFY